MSEAIEAVEKFQLRWPGEHNSSYNWCQTYNLHRVLSDFFGMCCGVFPRGLHGSGGTLWHFGIFLMSFAILPHWGLCFAYNKLSLFTWVVLFKVTSTLLAGTKFPSRALYSNKILINMFFLLLWLSRCHRVKVNQSGYMNYGGTTLVV